MLCLWLLYVGLNPIYIKIHRKCRFWGTCSWRRVWFDQDCLYWSGLFLTMRLLAGMAEHPPRWFSAESTMTMYELEDGVPGGGRRPLPCSPRIGLSANSNSVNPLHSKLLTCYFVTWATNRWFHTFWFFIQGILEGNPLLNVRTSWFCPVNLLRPFVHSTSIRQTWKKTMSCFHKKYATANTDASQNLIKGSYRCVTNDGNSCGLRVLNANTFDYVEMEVVCGYRLQRWSILLCRWPASSGGVLSPIPFPR